MAASGLDPFDVLASECRGSAFADFEGGREGRCGAHLVVAFLSPLRASNLLGFVVPRLAPWAAFLRRFAAERDYAGTLCSGNGTNRCPLLFACV